MDSAGSLPRNGSEPRDQNFKAGPEQFQDRTCCHEAQERRAEQHDAGQECEKAREIAAVIAPPELKAVSPVRCEPQADYEPIE
jgi:hypothetical protein